MAKAKIQYRCSACDYLAPSYLGRCPECEAWGTLAEETLAASSSDSLRTSLRASLRPATSSGSTAIQLLATPLQAVSTATTTARLSTGFGELDRVLGGGLMPGAYILLGGDPGIGKSTLMLQMAGHLGQQGQTVLYIAGEESPDQIRQRAERLGIAQEGILVFAETQIHAVTEAIRTLQPGLVIIDSIQAMLDPDVSNIPGSTSQIRATASHLMDLAKGLGIPIVLVGHVTKDGGLSGPKLLEHLVDTVLYFEGEPYQDFRMLRTVKNRFGRTQELGVFEMGAGGLEEVTNPSQLFLAERTGSPPPGSVTVCTIEGSRPLLVELQALVGMSTYPSPRRVVNGVESNRLHQVVAVLERRLGLSFAQQDLYVNVVGGIQIREPAADLGMAMALITSQRDIPLAPGTVVLGEVGLTGEIRPVKRLDDRIAEAEKIGFQRMIVPASSKKPEALKASTTLQVLPVRTLLEAVTACLPSSSHNRHPEERSDEGSPDLKRWSKKRTARADVRIEL